MRNRRSYYLSLKGRGAACLARWSGGRPGQYRAVPLVCGAGSWGRSVQAHIDKGRDRRKADPDENLHGGVNSQDLHSHLVLAKYVFPSTPLMDLDWTHSHADVTLMGHRRHPRRKGSSASLRTWRNTTTARSSLPASSMSSGSLTYTSCTTTVSVSRIRIRSWRNGSTSSARSTTARRGDRRDPALGKARRRPHGVSPRRRPPLTVKDREIAGAGLRSDAEMAPGRKAACHLLTRSCSCELLAKTDESRCSC